MGCGVLPRWCREDPAASARDGRGRKSGATGVIHGGTGARAPAWTALQVLVALVLNVSRFTGAYAPPLPWGFILSPSATLRVAGLAPRVKVEHTTV